MSGGDMERLTTAQAGKRAGVDRFALNRAAKAGVLHPIRDNRGALLWDAEELDRWAAERGARRAGTGREVPAAQDIAQAEIAALRDRLADAEGRAAHAETRAAVAEARAQGAEALAAERAERIEDLRRMLDAPRRRSWWPWTGGAD